MFKYVSAFKEKKILLKLFLTLFITVFSVMAILTSITFYWVRDKALHDVNTITELTLSNILHTITTTFTSAENSAYEIYHNATIEGISYNDDILKIMEASDYLNTVMSVNSYIKGLHIFDDQSMLLSKSSGIDTSYKAIYDLMKKNKILSPVLNKAVAFDQEIDLITFFYYERTGNPYNNIYVAVDIDLNEVGNLKSIDYRNAFRYMFIINREGKVIISFNNNDAAGNSFEKLLIADVIKGGKSSGSMNVEESGKKYTLNYIYSGDGKYCLIAANDLDILNLQISGIKKTLVNSFILLLICVMAISLVISKEMYLPINVFFDSVTEYIRNNESNSSKPDYKISMAKTVDEMVNKINTIGTRHLEEYSYIRHLLLKELVTGNMADNNTSIMSKIAEYKIFSGSDAPFLLILFKIDGLKDSGGASSKIKMDDLITIRKIAEEIIVKNNLNNKMTDIFNEEIIAIINVPDGFPQNDLKAILKEIQNIILDRCNILLTIGVSGAEEDINRLQKAYNEAYNLVKLKIAYGDGVIMLHDEFRAKETNSKELFGFIIESIKKCDEESFVRYFNELAENFKFMGYQNILNTLVNLCQDIYAILHSIDINSIEMNEVQVMDILRDIDSREELYYFFMSLYKEVEKTLNNINNNKTINNLKSAIDYIDSNYADTNLAASMIAEKISITPQHFSKLFKRFTGISFPDYLNDIRLSKAKELIDADPQIEMQEVSSKVGYSNSSYFSKSFREKYGITPTAYRQSQLDRK